MRVADFKAVKSVLGGTLNDVVLATVSGALRRSSRSAGSIRTSWTSAPWCRSACACAGRARSARQPGDPDHRAAARQPRPIPLEPARRRARHDERSEGVPAGAGRRGAHRDRRMDGAERAGAGRAARRADPAVQPHRHQRSRPADPALLPGLRSCARPTRWCRCSRTWRWWSGCSATTAGSTGASTRDWEQIPDLHDFILAIEDSFRELQERAALSAKRLSRATARRTRAPKPGRPKRGRRASAARR